MLWRSTFSLSNIVIIVVTILLLSLLLKFINAQESYEHKNRKICAAYTNPANVNSVKFTNFQEAKAKYMTHTTKIRTVRQHTHTSTIQQLKRYSIV